MAALSQVQVSLGGKEKTQQLCQLCAAIDLSKERHVHQPTFSALTESANRGCDGCQLFRYAILHQRPHLFKRYNVGPEDIAQWHLQLDSQDDCPDFHLACDMARDGSYWTHYRRLDQRESPDRSILWPERLRNRFRHHSPRDWPEIVQPPSPRNVELVQTPELYMRSFPDMDMCKAWLRSCSSSGTHDLCSGLRDVRLPTRVISIGTSQNACVRLVETSDQMGQYAALSHRWGTGPANFKTTQANLQQRLGGMQLNTLPKTFQDAVEVTRSLGFKYLWIDMICIIQDLESDWQVECSRMHLIYADSALTIAAAAAQDLYSGFLLPREQSGPSPVVLPGGGPPVLSFLDWYEGARKDEMPSFELNSRAWVLQERLLSPRLLTFGPHELFFDCRTGRSRELNPHETSSKADIYQSWILAADSDVKFDAWAAVLLDYTQCDLTRRSDILPAISGIARKFQDIAFQHCTPLGRYVAGLWTCDTHTPFNLLWEPCGPAKTYRENCSPQAPSWSWASFPGPVHYEISVKDEEAFLRDLCCTIISWDVQPAGLDPYGDVQAGGSLVMSAYATSKLHILTQDDHSSDEEEHYRHVFSVSRFNLENQPSQETFARERDSQVMAKVEHSYGGLLYSLITVQMTHFLNDFWTRWLVLVPSPSSPGRFRRIGTCNVLSKMERSEEYDPERDVKEEECRQWVEGHFTRRSICIE